MYFALARWDQSLITISEQAEQSPSAIRYSRTRGTHRGAKNQLAQHGDRVLSLVLSLSPGNSSRALASKPRPLENGVKRISVAPRRSRSPGANPQIVARLRWSSLQKYPIAARCKLHMYKYLATPSRNEEGKRESAGEKEKAGERSRAKGKKKEPDR